MKKILIIEDDPDLNRNIKEAFNEEQIETDVAFDGLIAEKFLKKGNYDCVILDINLPGKNGYDICSDFRIYNTSTPVLMLTAFDELEDKVQGFNSGTDDYLTKPFYMKELILRVQALIKRRNAENLLPENSEAVTFDDIVIHPKTTKVLRQGTELTLTAREYQILLRLVQAKGELVLKRDLIKEIWGTSFDANTNTIEVYINFLRKKVDKPFSKDSIKTKVGFGYYLEEK
ncbi:MAG TPA: response regulator transcription factor [Prolixibacteraceae bacterium]|nr:response regulator transcription factor [Prolixibacteraceae bacterium]